MDSELNEASQPAPNENVQFVQLALTETDGTQNSQITIHPSEAPDQFIDSPKTTYSDVSDDETRPLLCGFTRSFDDGLDTMSLPADEPASCDDFAGELCSLFCNQYKDNASQSPDAHPGTPPGYPTHSKSPESKGVRIFFTLFFRL